MGAWNKLKVSEKFILRSSLINNCFLLRFRPSLRTSKFQASLQHPERTFSFFCLVGSRNPDPRNQLYPDPKTRTNTLVKFLFVVVQLHGEADWWTWRGGRRVAQQVSSTLQLQIQRVSRLAGFFSGLESKGWVEQASRILLQLQIQLVRLAIFCFTLKCKGWAG
jgi:hypothetical protein